MARTARRYLHRTLDADLRVAGQIEKTPMHLAVVKSIGVPLEPLQQLAYLLVAHIEAMMTANGETVAVMPADLGSLMGASPTRCVAFLGELKRLGLLEGSAVGGYRLSSLDA